MRMRIPSNFLCLLQLYSLLLVYMYMYMYTFMALCVLFVWVAFLLLHKLVCYTHVFPCTCIYMTVCWIVQVVYITRFPCYYKCYIYFTVDYVHIQTCMSASVLRVHDM